MRTDDPRYSHRRNPLTFEDVALACAMRWCITEKAALRFLRVEYTDPGEALESLGAALKEQRAPDKFWETL